MKRSFKVVENAIRLLAYLSLTAILMGCSKVKERSLTILGVSYIFPEEHVDGFLALEQGGPYVRISPPKKGFLLEYSLTSLRKNQQGGDVPTIPHVNDVPEAPGYQIQVITTGDDIVVCEPGLLEYNCGFRLYDGPVPWSIRFTQGNIGKLIAIKSASLKLLSEYRRTP